ncbi:MAG: M23 family metallopeptidase [Terracidiphilus sp.]
MTGARIPRIVFLLAVAATVSVLAPPNHAQTDSGRGSVAITPALVVAGSPELIRVDAPAGATVDGEWLGRKLEFFRGRSGTAWFALAGVDVEAQVEASSLHISARTPAGGLTDLSRSIEIHPAHYRTSTLTVAPKFVAPGLDELPRIKAEIALKDKVFSTSAPEPLWSGDFRAPVHAAPTDSFGTRRVFNGELDSIHKGMDFRAAMGTPVRASNVGVVVLAQPLYYEGNCVVIDHGLGLFTISMHLSRIDVHEGQRVRQGELIGLSGATGRVTGPHLHWAVRWQNAYLDPAKLLQMNLNAVH